MALEMQTFQHTDYLANFAVPRVDKNLLKCQIKSSHSIAMETDECGLQPPPRSHTTLIAHPLKDELLLFGGEHQNGSKVTMYNDLYAYKISDKLWTRISADNPPLPRSSHQACAVETCGGQLWIFGGETSKKSRQVQHLRDLCVFHLTENKWEHVKCAGGPSARSGHRMTIYKRHLVVFGGFIDNNKSYTYYNDVYAFSLDDYTWTELHPSGNAPSPRSACQIGVVSEKGVVIYGGYSRGGGGRGDDDGTTHSDMFLLSPEAGHEKGSRLPSRWRWYAINQSGDIPSTRVGMTWIQTPADRAVAFGGVHDEVQNEDTIEGRFFNDLFMVQLESGHWYSDLIRTKKLTRELKRRRDKGDDSVMDYKSGADGCDSTDSIVKRLRLSTVQQRPASSVDHETMTADLEPPAGIQQPRILTESATSDMDIDMFAPPPRMSPCLAVKSGVLYVYGGFIEKRDTQHTLSDFYSLDLHKLTAWDVIVPHQPVAKASCDDQSSSEVDDSDSESDDGDSASDDERNTVNFADAERPHPGEDAKLYARRTRDYWLVKAQQCSAADSLNLSARNLQRLAKDLARQFYESL